LQRTASANRGLVAVQQGQHTVDHRRRRAEGPVPVALVFRIAVHRPRPADIDLDLNVPSWLSPRTCVWISLFGYVGELAL
jgi:hypothetical protein